MRMVWRWIGRGAVYALVGVVAAVLVAWGCLMWGPVVRTEMPPVCATWGMPKVPWPEDVAGPDGEAAGWWQRTFGRGWEEAHHLDASLSLGNFNAWSGDVAPAIRRAGWPWYAMESRAMAVEEYGGVRCPHKWELPWGEMVRRGVPTAVLPRWMGANAESRLALLPMWRGLLVDGLVYGVVVAGLAEMVRAVLRRWRFWGVVAAWRRWKIGSWMRWGIGWGAVGMCVTVVVAWGLILWGPSLEYATPPTTAPAGEEELDTEWNWEGGWGWEHVEAGGIFVRDCGWPMRALRSRGEQVGVLRRWELPWREIISRGYPTSDLPVQLHAWPAMRVPLVPRWPGFVVDAVFYGGLGAGLVWGVRRIKRRRREVVDYPVCAACGYNLTGLPAGRRCPECGTAAVIGKTRGG